MAVWPPLCRSRVWLLAPDQIHCFAPSFPILLRIGEPRRTTRVAGCVVRDRGAENCGATGQTLPHSSRVTGGPLSGRATRPRSLRLRLDHGSSGAPRLPGTLSRLSGDHSTSSLVKAPRAWIVVHELPAATALVVGNPGNPLRRYGAHVDEMIVRSFLPVRSRVKGYRPLIPLTLRFAPPATQGLFSFAVVALRSGVAWSEPAARKSRGAGR